MVYKSLFFHHHLGKYFLTFCKHRVFRRKSKVWKGTIWNVTTSRIRENAHLIVSQMKKCWIFSDHVFFGKIVCVCVFFEGSRLNFETSICFPPWICCGNIVQGVEILNQIHLPGKHSVITIFLGNCGWF